MFLKHLILFIIFTCSFFTQAQVFQESKEYTRADTLRGSLRPERTSFDVLKYNLNVKVEPDKNSFLDSIKSPFVF